ncbi:hypothetical protein PC121_g3252 [Phytophthora cactorum]|nr:hypothetical protein PC120_g16217 [Phytophthora cactorum]KAG3093804.1 hypothetical protein PC121_g3252 [Phytophthora cactorum]
MRNIFGRTVVHLSDEVPEVITFNIEIYNALFISYCMQNSPSFGTTLIVTADLLVQLALSLRDVYEATHRIDLVAQQLEEEHRRGDPRCQAKEYYFKCTSSFGWQLRGQQLQMCFSRETTSALAGVRIQPAPEDVVPAPKRTPQQLSSTSLQYVLEVRKLMYLTEFLVLIYYVGVFIPLIFSIYMVVMYHLPNRIYYAQLASLSKDELYDALTNVMFNCSLKLVALILLCSLLKYKLRLSAIHQLAFVLEKQWISVQTKAICWVYYNVQCFLQHQGYDYNFRFTWLKGR